MTTDMPVSYVLHETQLALDRPINIFLGHDETLPDNPDSLARLFLAETTSYWQDWVRDLNVPFDWQDAVIRAAITLKLCSFDDTGAIVAALTTSVPEAAGSARNWDYRFCWLRDAFFTVTALNRVSATRTMEAFVRFVLDSLQRAERSADLAACSRSRPAWTRANASPSPLAGLPRHRTRAHRQCRSVAASKRRVRIDRAHRGADVLGPAAAAARRPQSLPPALSGRPRGCHAALEPDAGLWEYRNRSRVHTFSAAMCWAALHRSGSYCAPYGHRSRTRRCWLDQAAKLRLTILERATVANEGWISGVLDGAVADASTLVLPEIGFISSQDERFVRTLEVVEKRLVRNGFVMRYDEADDFGMPENAFLLCTFWYIDALAKAGRRQEARALFENVLSCCNHVGLAVGGYRPKSRELWGNFPQTYSQVGLILSAMRVSRTWEEGLWHAVVIIMTEPLTCS